MLHALIFCLLVESWNPCNQQFKISKA